MKTYGSVLLGSYCHSVHLKDVLDATPFFRWNTAAFMICRQFRWKDYKLDGCSVVRRVSINWIVFFGRFLTAVHSLLRKKDTISSNIYRRLDFNLTSGMGYPARFYRVHQLVLEHSAVHRLSLAPDSTGGVLGLVHVGWEDE
jgi:hypothetical protein